MRVIAGKLGGRDLGAVPDGVRPTSDRVREALFSILGPLDGAQVLDLFAGTGALGIEAYSRGAKSVVFVEKSRRTSRALTKRLGRLGFDANSDEMRVVVGDAHSALRRFSRAQDGASAARFDLVFMDPPYAQGDRVGTLEALFAAKILSTDARVVVEAPKRHPVPPVIGGRILEERTYGETTLTWLAPAGGAED